MERLKKPIINKSDFLEPKSSILKSKKSKIKRIYKFALKNQKGQFEEFKANHEFSNEALKMAQQIQQIVERLAAFLKRRELKGVLKIFFRYGRLILELILHKCNINISYSVLNKELSTQVIVFTITMGGAAGFILSWFSVGAVLIAPSLLISTLFLRSFTNQILNQRDYLKFKKMVNKILEDDDVKETVRAFFLENEDLVSSSSRIEMGPADLDTNSKLKYDFNGESSQELDEFIKKRVEEEFGLVENPTETQLEKIIKKKVVKKSKSKTVYYQDFIKKITDSEPDLGIIDAEIIKEPIQVRTDNEL